MKRSSSLLLASWLILSLLSAPYNAYAYGIDDMVGPQWRYGIFAFLLFGMVFYAIAVIIYMRRGKAKLKKGEFIMLSGILVGIGLGMITAIVQLLNGYLL